MPKKPARVVFAEGEDERVLRAAQVLLEDGIGEPILIGRPQIIETRLQRHSAHGLAQLGVTHEHGECHHQRQRDAQHQQVAGREGEGGLTVLNRLAPHWQPGALALLLLGTLTHGLVGFSSLIAQMKGNGDGVSLFK